MKRYTVIVRLNETRGKTRHFPFEFMANVYANLMHRAARGNGHMLATAVIRNKPTKDK